MSRHIGSTLDDFLDEEGVLAEAEAVAVKRVIAYQHSTGRTDENKSCIVGAIARPGKCFGDLADAGAGGQGAGYACED
jgi:hypothetical protein